MTPMNPWFVTIPIAYLLGSIPFGYLLVKMVNKQDIRETGSGNIGATNVLRSGAKGLGIATLLLDLGKAFAAVKLAQHLAPGNWDLAVMAAVAAILGHVFPVWLGFRGGKGAASALGLMLALDWRAGACIFGLFLLVVLVSRYVSLGSIVGAISFPIFLLYFLPVHTPLVIAGSIFMALLVIAKHHQNIRRLMAGTENKFGGKK
jgi:acyl phosphate:glycerol-3-phosphate acyltransferase